MTLRRGHVTTATPEVSGIRQLTRGELSALEKPRNPVTIQTLRDNHHRVARCIASGMDNATTAQLCGYSINRISILKADPAFKDLVAHYQAILTAEWVKTTDHLMEVATTNMMKAEVMLGDKLNDAIEKNEFLPTRDLVAIAGDRMDRFGYGKVQKNYNVNVDFAANLEAARKRSSRPRQIEAQALEPVGASRLRRL